VQLVGLAAALAVVAQEVEVEEQADTVAAEAVEAAGIAAAAAAPLDHSKPHWLLIDKVLPPS